MGTRREWQRQGQSDQKRTQDPEKDSHSRPAGCRQRQETEIGNNRIEIIAIKRPGFGSFLFSISLSLFNSLLQRGKFRSIPFDLDKKVGLNMLDDKV